MKIFNRQLAFYALILFTILASSGASSSESFQHKTWDGLLKKHIVIIDDGASSQVDYAGMARDRKVLKQYLQDMANVSTTSFDAWNTSEQLAFLINAYNAWTVELILTAYPDLESIKDLGWLFRSPWKKKFIPLLGQTRSLDEIEHDMIRGSDRYHEPRIHFAANCASIGCPALRKEAYVGERLEQQLEQATRAFLQDRSRNRLENNRLYLSSIFKWYRQDFASGWRGSNSVQEFLARYSEELGLNPMQKKALLQGDLAIRYLDYDWRLNRSP